MRIARKQYAVYTLDEVKQAAIEKNWDINVDYEWWDGVYMDAETIGLKITGFDLDRNRYAKGNFMESARETAEAILKEHGTICDTYKLAGSFLSDRDKLIDEAPKDKDGEFEDEYELDGQLDDLEYEFRKELLEEYSIMLQREYEYRTSEEAILETLIANEYEFYEDGTIV